MNISRSDVKVGRSATAGRCCHLLRGVLLVALLTIGLGYGCVSRGRSGESTTTKNIAVHPSMQVVDMADVERVDTLDLGRVRMGERVSRTFALHNNGDRPMVVLSTETACGCLSLDYPQVSVGVGEKVGVEMHFDSAGYTYFFIRSFTIMTTLSEKGKKLVVVATME